jgi:hypothetical protein
MSFSYPTYRRPMVSSFAALAVIGFSAACAPATLPRQTSANPNVSMSASAPTPDPRVGLRGGAYDAAEAVWNLRVLSETRPSEKFAAGINSDLAFLGNYVFQGSFSGYQVWDISNPRQPVLRTAYVCPASQSEGFASSTSATSTIRKTSATCRRAAGRTPTACSSIRRIPPTSTSTSPARVVCGRRASWRDV